MTPALNLTNMDLNKFIPMKLKLAVATVLGLASMLSLGSTTVEAQTIGASRQTVRAVLETGALSEDIGKAGFCSVSILNRIIPLTYNVENNTAKAETNVDVIAPGLSVITLAATTAVQGGVENPDLNTEAKLTDVASGKRAVNDKADTFAGNLGVKDKIDNKTLTAYGKRLLGPDEIYGRGDNGSDSGVVRGDKNGLLTMTIKDLDIAQGTLLSDSERIYFDAYIECTPVIGENEIDTMPAILRPVR